MQSSSAGAASDELFDLRGASDLILPADLSNPDDPKVYVVDPKAADAWRTQASCPALIKPPTGIASNPTSDRRRI